MQTYQQFKEASVRSDAVWGEALAGPMLTNGAAPLGAILTAAVPAVKRHRTRTVQTLGSKEFSQQWGPAVSIGVPIGVSAAIGGSLLPPASQSELALGILGAAAAAHIGGGLLAAVTPTWDEKKMKEYKKSRLAGIADWLVPGAGVYHRMKTIGYIADKKSK